ncbi:GatB/YqeY domain-containing protein [uncultured Campylobacter sp.]|uniref:GatB/YqeY domain-containing protein n=1 Tax=uncultured Campylobacter sp. TaxID=218934 RepID=UPI0025D9A8F2|nr:GatB/YqeY domain-containing protein [uncultured Campylobacter sp.]
MSIREKILADIKEAMKTKNDFERDALRTLNAALKQVEVDNRIEMTDDVVLPLLQKEMKKRADAIELYQKGGRDDLAQIERKESELIARYLPSQLTDGELEAEISQIIAQTGADGVKDLGVVMKAAKERIGASADAKRISECVKRLLG